MSAETSAPEALPAEIDLTRTALRLSSKPGIRVNALRAWLEDKSARAFAPLKAITPLVNSKSSNVFLIRSAVIESF
jgi:hypothetical protein